MDNVIDSPLGAVEAGPRAANPHRRLSVSFVSIRSGPATEGMRVQTVTDPVR